MSDRFPIPCPNCRKSDELFIVEHDYVGDTGTPHHEVYVECGHCKYRGQSARTRIGARYCWNHYKEL